MWLDVDNTQWNENQNEADSAEALVDVKAYQIVVQYSLGLFVDVQAWRGAH